MAKFTFTLDDEQQAIAEEMASHSNQSVKDCLSRLLTSRIAHYATQVAEQKWSEASPEQKKAALTVLSKGAKKDGNKKQKATKKKAG
jgi:hypothetical protein